MVGVSVCLKQIKANFLHSASFEMAVEYCTVYPALSDQAAINIPRNTAHRPQRICVKSEKKYGVRGRASRESNEE